MSRTHVALLRGINVGGHNSLPMAQLRGIAEGLAWGEVATYIQSGNLVFTATGERAALEAALQSAIRKETGLDLPVLVLTRAEALALATDCPWPDVVDPRLVHVFVYPFPLTEQARSGVEAAATAGPDEVRVSGRILYVHTPAGFSRSTVVPLLDRAALRRVTGRGTARNLATVRKIGHLFEPSPGAQGPS
ncbi:MAG: DUF1697 domain-containing protein [Ornithinimicrobium sp.]|uniref:DUF1697 domain-containing protein n=1 Tax=Ornithinimicrobium sp. TaxID=1977084 RepID=UPI0026E08F56|nr:DUF1697 domain-containing protein [Ornithinimicrobium sp.]MDO5740708.1 DUF1697 domain-containing protein [Ornithinimicrobium sp.]